MGIAGSWGLGVFVSSEGALVASSRQAVHMSTAAAPSLLGTCAADGDFAFRSFLNQQPHRTAYAQTQECPSWRWPLLGWVPGCPARLPGCCCWRSWAGVREDISARRGPEGRGHAGQSSQGQRPRAPPPVLPKQHPPLPASLPRGLLCEKFCVPVLATSQLGFRPPMLTKEPGIC